MRIGRYIGSRGAGGGGARGGGGGGGGGGGAGGTIATSLHTFFLILYVVN